MNTEKGETCSPVEKGKTDVGRSYWKTPRGKTKEQSSEVLKWDI